jgi:hypothetical protein
MNVVQQLQAFLAESVLRTDEETAPVHLALGACARAPLGEPLGFESGLTLQPAHLAILAAANVAEVPTRGRRASVWFPSMRNYRAMKRMPPRP